MLIPDSVLQALDTYENLAKYNQDLDYLLFVPAQVQVPSSFKAPNYEINEPKKLPTLNLSFNSLFREEDFAQDDVIEEQETVKEELAFVSSPLHFRGSKFRVVSEIVHLLPQKINYFYDVFSGAGNIGINVPAQIIICLEQDGFVAELLEYLRTQEYKQLMRKLDYLIYRYNLSNSAAYGYEVYDSNSDQGLASTNRKPYQDLREDFNHLLKQRIIQTHILKNQVTTPKQVFISAAMPNPQRLTLNEPLCLRLLLLMIYGFNNKPRFNQNFEFNQQVGKRDLSKAMRTRFKLYLDKIRSREIRFINLTYDQLDISQLVQEDAFVFFDQPEDFFENDIEEKVKTSEWWNTTQSELFNFLLTLDTNGLKFAYATTMVLDSSKDVNLLYWANLHGFHIYHLNTEEYKKYRNSSLQRAENKDVHVIVYNFRPHLLD